MDSKLSRLSITLALTVGIALGAVALLRLRRGGVDELSETFQYDLTGFRQTDPELILYEPAGQFKTGVLDPRALAMGPEGKLYVAGKDGVRMFNLEGQLQSFIAQPETVTCLTVSDERLFLGTQTQVSVHSTDGTQLATWTPIEGTPHLTSIAVSGEHVFVADAGNRVVWHFDDQGTLLGRIGERDTAKGISGFVIPSPYFDVAVAPDGLLRVVNPGKHRIEIYTFDGELELTWGEYGADIERFCGCCNPVNFAMFADGRYVTAEKGLTRVKVYQADGSFLGVVAGPESYADSGHACEESADCQTGGLDVAVLGDQVIVLDTLTSEVLVYRPKQASSATTAQASETL